MIRLFAVGVALAASPVMAQDLVYSDRATDQCMADGGTVSGCAGLSADACMSDTIGGHSTYGMGGCLDAELGYWDSKLNIVYQARVAAAKDADKEAKDYGGSAPSQFEALREMQRAWTRYRDAKCDYARSQWGGGTGGGPAMLGCLLTTTAEQAVYLENAGMGN